MEKWEEGYYATVLKTDARRNFVCAPSGDVANADVKRQWYSPR
jgi:hypothetical protein